MVRRKEAGLRANSSWKQRELPSARDFAASRMRQGQWRGFPAPPEFKPF